jgi:hypothetical protein
VNVQESVAVTDVPTQICRESSFISFGPQTPAEDAIQISVDVPQSSLACPGIAHWNKPHTAPLQTESAGVQLTDYLLDGTRAAVLISVDTAENQDSGTRPARIECVHYASHTEKSEQSR